MVRLRNIVKNNTIIEADLYPETCKEPGHIIVDLKSGKVKSSNLPAGYEDAFNYATHAKQGLLELANREDIPKEYLVMWY